MKRITGFVRKRKRTTKGRGVVLDYDIVRAVRINGQPRHKCVFSLGTFYGQQPIWFWMNAVERMTKAGLSKAQRQYFIAACVRKGARLPTQQECHEYENWNKQWDGWWKVDDARKLRAVRALVKTRNKQQKG